MSRDYSKNARELLRDANRRHPYIRQEWRTTPRSVQVPTMSDIAWAAGIYEGEGSCQRTPNGSVSLTVCQVDRWLIDKLQQLFGGSVSTKVYGPSNPKRSTKHTWFVSGARARGFAYTIFSHMSPRRRSQIKAALGVGRVT